MRTKTLSGWIIQHAIVVAASLLATSAFSQPPSLQADEGFVDAHGVRLYYQAIGTGEPVVILHGGPGLDHSYLLPHFAELANSYRLIFFDQRAAGRSSVPDSTGISLNAFLEDIDAVRTAFGVKDMNLLGHSWGAFLAMQYAVRYPQNLKSLILVNPAAASNEDQAAYFAEMSVRRTREDSLARAAMMQSSEFHAQHASAFEALMRLSFKRMFADTHLLERLQITLPSDFAFRSEMLRFLANDVASYDLYPQLKSVETRALIVHGDYDPLPVERVQKMHAALKNSQLVVIERCGHFPFIEARQRFVDAVRSFLP
jgi:proline iminopeptidase